MQTSNRLENRLCSRIGFGMSTLARFFLRIHCGLCFTEEGDSDVEDAKETNEHVTDGEDQPPTKVRCMLSYNLFLI